MLTKTSRFAMLLCFTAVLVGGAHSRSGAPLDPSLARPTPTPTPWPNLDTLDKFTNPSGNTCGIDGAATHGTEKAALNDLKNRYRLPQGQFGPITFSQLLALNQGHVTAQRKIIGFPDSKDPNNQRAVSLVGFVDDVFTGGCAVHQGGKGGESCNCNTTDKNICDTHINVIPKQGVSSAGGHNVFVVEVTERARRLAAKNLLTSNIGNDWSTGTLKAKLKGHWVRFSGYLFFDTDHFDQAWVTDSDDNIGGSNFRETAWEIHPVMQIQVDVAPPNH